MNLMRSFFLLIFSLSVVIPSYPQKQDDKNPTELWSLYFDNIYGDDERLISGHIYLGPLRGSIRGHPYYFDESWKEGTIGIPDTTFSGLQLKYDIYVNRLILKHTAASKAVYQIGLNSGNIISAKVGNIKFIPLPGGNDSVNIPLAEVVSSGPMLYLVTKGKTLQVTSSSGSTDYEYKEYVKHYLFYNDALIPFKGKKTLYKTFPEMKRALKRFCRQNGLYLIRNRINERKRLIDYCNTILTGNNE